ncbi:MAG: ATP-binding cassette domain-containing protein [Oligoflexia bacterium]|nr:ATP-binding cassette domain-containing protein [Oligoflexia bacterium]
MRKTVDEEQAAVRKEYQLLDKEFKRLDREVKNRRSEASKADQRRSKRHIDKHDHDAKEKIDRARVTGKDGVGGKLLNQLMGRHEQLNIQKSKIKVKKEYITGIEIEAEVSKRDFLLKVTPESIAMGGSVVLQTPELIILPQDRIALTGRNGSGKSTLLRHIVERLSNIDYNVKYIYIPQEITEQASREILHKVKMLNAQRLGAVMTIITRLGSDPKRLLESTTPSPGEVRKLLVAEGIASSPQIIIMDEPTNHLDLVSIEALEFALKEVECALLLVSHDMVFLNTLTDISWQITTEKDAYSIIHSIIISQKNCDL